MSNFVITVRIFGTLLFTIVLSSCGNSDSNKTSTSTDQSVFNVDLSSASAGDQYIIMPFILGDTSTINGKTSDSAGSFTASSTGASLRIMTPSNTSTLHDNHQAQLKTLVNRFAPSERNNRIKTYQAIQDIKTNLSLRDGETHRLGEGFMRLEQTIQEANRFKSSYPLQTTTCPTSFFSLASDSAIDINGSDVYKYENEDFCLVFLESTVASEQNVTNIELSIQNAIDNFKVIFDTDFTETVSNYSFKPLIVVAPSDNTNYWPASLESLSVVLASTLSSSHQRPTIYLAADQTISGSSETDAADNFHGTIGHELFHAVFNYYRIWVNSDGTGDADTVSIDEGLAHFIEDLLGYGPVNFDAYASAFLAEYPGSHELELISIFDDTQTELANVNRGAAQTFFYYLMSQKGGITFTDGKATSGGGLEFIRTFVKGTTPGVAGLEAAYGSTWKTAFSDYLEALQVNGSDLAASKHSIQSPEENKNLIDGASTFGMQFSNYSGLATLNERLASGSYSEPFTPEEMIGVSLNYYELAPYILTITDDGPSFVLTFAEGYTNAGVSVVKVK